MLTMQQLSVASPELVLHTILVVELAAELMISSCKNLVDGSAEEIRVDYNSSLYAVEVDNATAFRRLTCSGNSSQPIN